MKRFQSFEEIKNEPGFQPDNPVDPANYSGLVGYYAFAPGEDVECCVRKPNGNRCVHKHLRGWVPRLADGSITVIGGTCAKEKFGAESIVARDITAATKVINREADIARLKELLKQREAKHQALDRAYKSCNRMKDRLSSSRREIGDAAWNRMVGMSRTGDNAIAVLGIVDAIRDDEGKVVRDRQVTQIVVGRLSHLDACQTDKVQKLQDDVRRSALALRIADEEMAGLKGKEIKACLAALEEGPRTLEKVIALENSVNGFLANDFTPLAFTTDNRSERVRIAQLALGRSGKPAGPGPAKSHLHDLEAKMKAQFKVERLQII